MFFRLAYKSLLNRKGSAILTLMAMTVSVFVLIAVEHIRYQAKESFSNTVSGVDLIVGARTGSLNLLLYSVFRIGTPTNNISWSTYEKIASSKNVKWAIPIALGDSHKGYRVMGTTTDYFDYFSYGNKHKLEFKQGRAFESVLDVVIGAEIASTLGYSIGDKLVLSHGVAATSFSNHDDHPFRVVGILAPTGTPVDQTLHVSLKGIEAIHLNWQQGVKMRGRVLTEEQINQLELQPKSITAFMLGLTSRLVTFKVQRDINQFKKEPVMAILPGVALSELWQMMRMLESTLRLISVLVLVAALLGLSAMLLASIRERTREVQLLRAVGASPFYLFWLIELEAMLITFLSCVFGVLGLNMCLVLVGDFLSANYGLYVSPNILTEGVVYLLVFIVVSALVAAAVPSISMYRSAKVS